MEGCTPARYVVKALSTEALYLTTTMVHTRPRNLHAEDAKSPSKDKPTLQTMGRFVKR
jgi:hypothetical protein